MNEFSNSSFTLIAPYLKKLDDDEFAEVRAAVNREGQRRLKIQKLASRPDVDRRYDVDLIDAGSDVIKVIKETRALTGLGLKEAKDLVDKTRGDFAKVQNLKKRVTLDEAKQIQRNFGLVGGNVRISEVA